MIKSTLSLPSAEKLTILLFANAPLGITTRLLSGVTISVVKIFISFTTPTSSCAFIKSPILNGLKSMINTPPLDLTARPEVQGLCQDLLLQGWPQ